MKKFFSLFILICMISGMMMGNNIVKAAISDLINLDIVGVDENPDGTIKNIYFSTETSNYTINLDISGKDTVLDGYYMIVKVPKNMYIH